MQPLAKFLSSTSSRMPDITWHLLVNRTTQRTRTSCSVASLTIAFNGLISAGLCGDLDKPLTESAVLDMLPESEHRSKIAEGRGGATLDQIGEMAESILQSLKLCDFSVSVHHMDESKAGGRDSAEVIGKDSGEGGGRDSAEGIGKKSVDDLGGFRSALLESGAEGRSVVIANYHQGVVYQNDFAHGHFAPVAPVSLIGADSDREALLGVVDPAVEGVPYVIDLEHFGRAMSTTDNTAGRTRGYLSIGLG